MPDYFLVISSQCSLDRDTCMQGFDSGDPALGWHHLVEVHAYTSGAVFDQQEHVHSYSISIYLPYS